MVEDDTKFEPFSQMRDQAALALEQRRQVEEYIREQIQALGVTGAHDSEANLFDQLLKELNVGGEPEKIRTRAKQIVDGRILDH